MRGGPLSQFDHLKRVFSLHFILTTSDTLALNGSWHKFTLMPYFRKSKCFFVIVIECTIVTIRSLYRSLLFAYLRLCPLSSLATGVCVILTNQTLGYTSGNSYQWTASALLLGSFVNFFNFYNSENWSSNLDLTVHFGLFFHTHHSWPDQILILHRLCHSNQICPCGDKFTNDCRCRCCCCCFCCPFPISPWEGTHFPHW